MTDAAVPADPVALVRRHLEATVAPVTHLLRDLTTLRSIGAPFTDELAETRKAIETASDTLVDLQDALTEADAALEELTAHVDEIEGIETDDEDLEEEADDEEGEE